MTKEATGIHTFANRIRIQLESSSHPDHRGCFKGIRLVRISLKHGPDPSDAMTADNFAQQHCLQRFRRLSALPLQRVVRFRVLAEFPAAIIYPAYIIQSALFPGARESRQKERR